jgi:DegV family protein with EDD domain
MKKYVIVTDSCSDLDSVIRKEADIEYIKNSISYSGKETLISLNWEEFTPKEFYDKMREGVVFKTSQVPIERFCEEFRKFLDAELDVLYLSTSSALSGSINSSIIAKNLLLPEYPERKIICVDTLRGSLGQGLIVWNAAGLRAEGKSIEAVAKWVEDNRLNFHQVGSVDDLTYLKRAGRVTGIAAFMSGIFKIKPIIIASAKGENESVAKVRGRRASINAALNYVKEHIINPETQTLFIVHADCPDEANEIKQILLETVKCKDVYINYVGPVIGSTVGPGMFSIYFKGDKVS